LTLLADVTLGQQQAPGAAAAAPPPPPAAPPKSQPPANSFDGIGKGFLDGKNKLYGKKGSDEGSDKNGTFDAEFQKLMEAADPAFASQFKDPRSKSGGLPGGENDLMTEALASLAGVIEPGGMPADHPGMTMGLDLDAIAAKASKEKIQKEREQKLVQERMAAALEDDSAARKAKIQEVLKHNTKLTASGVDVVIDLSTFPSEGKLSMNDMELEVGNRNIVLHSKYGSVAVPLSEGLDEDNVGAKLSQKKRTLTVSVANKREKL
jgi:hypothetical protein